MKRLLSVLSALALTATPVFADPEIRNWKTMHSLGCLLTEECKDDVTLINSIEDIQKLYPDVDYSEYAEEFNALIKEFKRIGINPSLAGGKYFPRMHRGVYATNTNNFFLNKEYMNNPKFLIDVTRHEGWHAVQDCMAGTIDNNHIAIVHPEESIPTLYRLRADVAYSGNPHVIPWESEALWAGEQPDVTLNALKVCKNDQTTMWDVYTPTPMTGEWLIKKGFWDGN